MTTFNYPAPAELTVVGLFDAGIANRERVVFRVEAPLHFANFYVGLAIKLNDGNHSPLTDFVYWMGHYGKAEWAPPGALIILYTGRGEDLITTVADEAYIQAYVMHWGRDKTLMSTADATFVVPMVMKVDAVGFARRPLMALGDRVPVRSIGPG
jgi:hypothetical protein